MLRILTLTFVCCFMIQEGASIECFQCTSLSSDGNSCGDPFTGDPSITPKCNLQPGVEGFCVKQQVISSGGDIRVTTRTCQPKDSSYCEKLQGTLEATDAGTVEHCSYCNDDLCNAAPKSGTVSLSALLLVAAATFKHFIF